MLHGIKNAAARFSTLSGLQLFQLIRYFTFILVGIGFAKLPLPTSEIARFETFMMITGMVSFFWISGIINSMLSLYPKKDDEEKRELLFNTFLLLFIFGTISAAAFMLFVWLMPEPAYNGLHLFSPIGGFAVYILVNAVSFLIEYILFLKEKKKLLIIYAVFTAVITLAALLLSAWLSQHGWTDFAVQVHYFDEFPYFFTAAMCGIALIKFSVLMVLLNRYASFKINYGLLKSNLIAALPLMLSLIVSGSAEYIDGLIINAKFTPSAFAVYRYGAKELPVLLIIANTFSSAMIPAVAHNLNAGLEEIRTRSARLMHLFFPVTIVLMFISPFLFEYLFNSNFVFSSFIFNIYLLLVIPRLLFPQTILTGMQHNRYLLLSSVLEIVINVSLSIYLAGKIGLAGVAVGTFVAYCFDKVFLLSVAYFAYGIHPRTYVRVPEYTAYSAATLFAFALSYFLFYEL